jgi:hypothetical protein
MSFRIDKNQLTAHALAASLVPVFEKLHRWREPLELVESQKQATIIQLKVIESGMYRYLPGQDKDRDFKDQGKARNVEETKQLRLEIATEIRARLILPADNPKRITTLMGLWDAVIMEAIAIDQLCKSRHKLFAELTGPVKNAHDRDGAERDSSQPAKKQKTACRTCGKFHADECRFKDKGTILDRVGDGKPKVDSLGMQLSNNSQANRRPDHGKIINQQQGIIKTLRTIFAREEVQAALQCIDQRTLDEDERVQLRKMDAYSSAGPKKGPKGKQKDQQKSSHYQPQG